MLVLLDVLIFKMMINVSPEKPKIMLTQMLVELSPTVANINGTKYIWWGAAQKITNKKKYSGQTDTDKIYKIILSWCQYLKKKINLKIRWFEQKLKGQGAYSGRPKGKKYKKNG